MNVILGGNRFQNVRVPLLWGSRAVLQDQEGRISVVDLSGSKPRLEIIWGRPAEGLHYRPMNEGLEIVTRIGDPLYQYYRDPPTLSSLSESLPDCIVLDDEVRVGTASFQNNAIRGAEVGIHVKSDGSLSLGTPLPAGLSDLATLSV